MATLNNYAKRQTVKALLIGNSGNGKTGSIASLVKAGYNVRILDFDKGVAPLVGVLKKEPNADELLAKVDCVQLSDTYKAGKCTAALAWKEAQSLMSGQGDWKPYGDITTWGPDTVLVVDSLTHCGNAIFNFILSMNSRLGARQGVKGGIEMNHWGQAMQEQESLLATLYDDEVKCHVLVLAHITVQEMEDGATEGFPTALGTKLPPKVGSYFNNLFVYRKVGFGPGLKREISTKGNSLIAGKAETLDLPATLPIETGLASIFQTILGASPHVQA